MPVSGIDSQAIRKDVILMELDLDTTIRWVSDSSTAVVGKSPSSLIGKKIGDYLIDDYDRFVQATEQMLKNTLHSFRMHFQFDVTEDGPLTDHDDSSRQLISDSDNDNEGVFDFDDRLPMALELEAQGIVIVESNSKTPSYTMWTMRPYGSGKPVALLPPTNMDPTFVEFLGSGGEELAQFLYSSLEQAVTSGVSTPDRPPPVPVLCHICESNIPSWFFEKHSELCAVTHKAEFLVQDCQDALQDHRIMLVSLSNALEKSEVRPEGPMPEYAGRQILAPGMGGGGGSSLGPHSPYSTPESPRRKRRSLYDRSSQIDLVEMLMDICDIALDINMPSIREEDHSMIPEEMRLQSPPSENRINEVMRWSAPNSNDPALALLIQDTYSVVNTKVDAVLRLKNVIIYSERITQEINAQVDQAFESTLEMAAERVREEQQLSEAQNKSKIQSQNVQRNTSYPIGLEATAMDTSSTEIHIPRRQLSDSSVPRKRNISNPLIIPPERWIPGERINPRQKDLREDSSSSSGALRSPVPMLSKGENTDGNESDYSRSSSTNLSIPKSGSIEIPGRQSRATKGLYGSPRRLPSPGRRASPQRRVSPSPLRSSSSRQPSYQWDISPTGSPIMVSADNEMYQNSKNHKRAASSHSDQLNRIPPLSPRMPSMTSVHRTAPTSIKDFDVIKPISKGAFGSVYLTRKKATGIYYAIKVLRKSNMVSKNQVTNVRAERAILMSQGDSPFVARLFFTFQSKDYLYLVMEYLNGGDCAALLKNVGSLPEEWAKRYVAEVVLGLRYLHRKGIVHRDLKPDNLLIDSKGHLKLTDFGLSRTGLVGRQARANEESFGLEPIDPVFHGKFIGQSLSRTSSRSVSHDNTVSPSSTPLITPDAQFGNSPGYFNLNYTINPSASSRAETQSVDSTVFDREETVGVKEPKDNVLSRPSSGSGDPNVLATTLARLNFGEKSFADDDASSDSGSVQSFTAQGFTKQLSSHGARFSPKRRMSNMSPPEMALFDPNDSTRRFVGTPDYLAPETIKGTGQDDMGDWWSLGVILFEFIYGYPPFHAERPSEVFENILARKIDWPTGEYDVASQEAKDLMERLMCSEPSARIGSKGAEEVMQHPFFAGIDWTTICEEKSPFIPQCDNVENTQYFDPRGNENFFTEEMQDLKTSDDEISPKPLDQKHEFESVMPMAIPAHMRSDGRRERRLSEPYGDFGSFAYRNLPILEKANKETIQRLRSEHLLSSSLNSPTSPE